MMMMIVKTVAKTTETCLIKSWETYADDLVLWCSEEHLITANYRLKQVLNTLEGWAKRWLVKINPRKTTYTIFSLSTKEQKATLHINGQTLLAEDNPTSGGDFRQAPELETTN